MRPVFGPGRPDFGCGRPDFGPEACFWPTEPDFGLRRSRSGPGRPKLGRMEGQMDRRTDGHMEIHPCVLQDIGPLGPLPCSQPTITANHTEQGKGIADHMLSLDY